MQNISKTAIFLYFLLGTIPCILQAQPTWTLNPFGNEKKPAKYEEKLLPSEKTGTKISPVKKFLDNTTTRYNYYFNATEKINAVIASAKESQKDDYSRLLSFYPYSLEATAAQKAELDSVIYKATAGVLLHSLLSDWVDDMYFLIGKSYFLQKKFDSAALTFQFINYNLYPRKKGDDGYGRVVGGNASGENGGISIANLESKNVIKKTLQVPPRRNDALIWMARTHVENNEYADAAGMLNILRQDPNLPARLQNDLEEITAYWFYAQNNYDSAANHLQLALSNASTKDDLARWEFLLAQMYEQTGRYDEASEYYAKAGKHTTSPVMEIYASLNDAKMLRDNGDVKELDNAIARLIKMAGKDKYDGFQDIILSSAGLLSLRRPDTLNAKGLFLKSIAYSPANPGYKNAALLQLASISYGQQMYKESKFYYDSLSLDDKETAALDFDLDARKDVLTRLVSKLDIIEKEDSLQRIAALPAGERDALIKKLVKQYRRANGIKEEDNAITGGANIIPNVAGKDAQDIFAASAKGEWYFYNNSMRSRGFSEFKSKWGKRENVDNWRRRSAFTAPINNGGPGDPNAFTDPGTAGKDDGTKDSTGGLIPFSYDALMADVPLTKEAVQYSNDKILQSLLTAAKIFQEELEDYPQAIKLYEDFERRFGYSAEMPKIYLGLYYSYNKMGNMVKANEYKNKLAAQYSGSAENNMVQNPGLLNDKVKDAAVTRTYETIYEQFIEGNFEQAIALKQQADATHGTNYWSPQLLYIEAVYYIKQRQDSQAINILTNIERLYPTSDITPKAVTLKSVLARRAEIEAHLNGLEVTRAEENKIITVQTTTPTAAQPATVAPKPAPVVQPITANVPTATDDPALSVPSTYKNANYQLSPSDEHVVIMYLDKVDPVYVNEAKNAINRFNQQTNDTRKLQIIRDVLQPQQDLLVIGRFADADAAVVYYKKLKAGASREMPWLPATKYSFYIINDNNLGILKEKKDLPVYKQLLNLNYNNIF